MRLSGFSIAIAFLRIPRLFFALLLIPVLLAVVALVFQLLGTLVLVEMINPSGKKEIATTDSTKPSARPNLGRLILYASSAPLAPIEVCRWVEEIDGEKVVELPPSEECRPSKIDVAIRTSNPETFDVTPFVSLFNENVRRLHLCKACTPDIILETEGGSTITRLKSVWGMVVVGLVNFNTALEAQRHKIVESKAEIESKIGEVFFYAEGTTGPVSLRQVVQRFALVGNIGGIVLVGLWLALKAHRKILNLFSKSGALLPLVAGLGKREFYGALWWITLLRVGGYLLGAIPLTAYTFRLLADAGLTLQLRASYLLLWLTALVMSFSFATVITSIADLKERHGLGVLMYLWLPLLICGSGTLVWGVTFLFDSYAMGIFRSLLTSIPIVGMGPLLLSPVMPGYESVLVVHGALAALAIKYASTRNAEWLAAHLEEV